MVCTMTSKQPYPRRAANYGHWGQTDLALLRNYSDREIAQMTRRTPEEIVAKRLEIDSGKSHKGK
jgi:hypothetical protein